MQHDSNSKQLRWQDFVAPNPFIRTWMLPFLPRNIILQDFVIMVAGCLAGLFLVFFILQILGEAGEYVAVIIGLGLGFAFQYDFRARYYAAFMICSREKKKSASAHKS